MHQRSLEKQRRENYETSLTYGLAPSGHNQYKFKQRIAMGPQWQHPGLKRRASESPPRRTVRRHDLATSVGVKGTRELSPTRRQTFLPFQEMSHQHPRSSRRPPTSWTCATWSRTSVTSTRVPAAQDAIFLLPPAPSGTKAIVRPRACSVARRCYKPNTF